MKKLFLLCSAMVLLTGCTLHPTIDLQKTLEQNIAKVQKEKISLPSNNKPYYSYYIEPSIGRISSNGTSNVLLYDGNPFVMNLNITGLISTKYYTFDIEESLPFKKDKIVAKTKDNYVDIKNHEHAFIVNIYQIEDYYMTVFVSDTVDFYAITDLLTSAKISGVMLDIARSVAVKEDAVIADYYNQKTEVYEEEKIKLFDSIAPENGRIEELFDDNDTIPSDDDYTSDGQTQIDTDEESMID